MPNTPIVANYYHTDLCRRYSDLWLTLVPTHLCVLLCNGPNIHQQNIHHRFYYLFMPQDGLHTCTCTHVQCIIFTDTYMYFTIEKLHLFAINSSSDQPLWSYICSALFQGFRPHHILYPTYQTNFAGTMPSKTSHLLSSVQ